MFLFLERLSPEEKTLASAWPDQLKLDKLDDNLLDDDDFYEEDYDDEDLYDDEDDDDYYDDEEYYEDEYNDEDGKVNSKCEKFPLSCGQEVPLECFIRNNCKYFLRVSNKCRI